MAMAVKNLLRDQRETERERDTRERKNDRELKMKNKFKYFILDNK